MTAPLADVRVIDLSTVLAGPFAGRMLAELGADVVKVESPTGDPARRIGPQTASASTYFATMNVGKRGVVLDLDDGADRASFDRLLATADVLLHNFRPAAANRFAVATREVAERHPHLVVVNVAGYGSGSPRADEPAYDVTAQAEAGIMALSGVEGGATIRAGVPVGDLAAAFWAALAAVSGIVAARRDGAGHAFEVPLLDATLTLLSYVATATGATGQDPPRMGSGHHSLCPYGAYPTRDVPVVIAVLSDKHWLPLCHGLELTDAAGKPEWRTATGRLEARDAVDARVAAATSRLSSDQVHARLRDVGVANAPVLGVAAALSTPYVQDQNIIVDVGGHRIVRGPLGRDVPLCGAPRLGEHTDEILAEARRDNALPEARR